MFQIFDA